jgi:hypothetical protein
MFKGGKDDDDVSIKATFENYFRRGSSTYSEIYSIMPPLMRMQVDYARTLISMSQKEPYLFAMPNIPAIE